MRWSINHIVFVLALTFSLTQATSHYSRDESQEDASTLFDVASTFKGGITSNRHHARAHLNSQLYPDLTQLPAGQTGDIDAPSAHEGGGSGIDLRAGYSGQASAPAACGRPAPGAYPNAISTGCQPAGGASVGYPTQQYPANPNPLAAVHSGGNPPGVYPSYGPHQPAYPLPQPGYGYPGTYQPQYPAYPPGYYPSYGPGVPVVTFPGAPPPPPPPPTSYQNQQNYAPQGRPGGRDHWDHSFKMKTEYTEDGVHKGPFAVLNNHGGQGYGSGYGGGYNGAFNRPGY